MSDKKKALPDEQHEGTDEYFMDIDRMVNEGLGAGMVSPHNGMIDQATEMEKESPPLDQQKE